MQRARFRSVAIACVFASSSFALGCSGGQQEQPPAQAPSAPAESAEPEAALELTPVPAPAELVARATWRSPSSTLDTLIGWMQPGLDWRAVLHGALSDDLPVEVLDLTQPIDAVVTLDPTNPERPRPLFAVAFGLGSQRAALDALQSRGVALALVEPGVYALDLGPRTSCFVAAALGPSSSRLICSNQRESLDALGPYLARGEPSKAAPPVDLSAELLTDALWQRYAEQAELLKSWLPLVASELPIESEELRTTVSVAARALADEAVLFLGDLSRVHLEAHTRAERELLELRLGSDYRSARSWLAESAADAPARASVAPEAFWSLPGDATSASHYAPSDPARYEGILRTAHELAGGTLRQLDASNAAREGWLKAFGKLRELAGPWVSANGMAAPEGSAPDAREHARARFGYKIFGVEDKGDVVTPLIEQSLALYEDAGLRRGLTQRFGIEAASLPKVQQRRATLGKATRRTYELALPVRLLDDEASGELAAGTIPLTIVTLRNAPWTWIGLSSYEGLLEQRLTAVHDPRTGAPTLEGRAGLDALKTVRASAAGFLTLAELLATYPLSDDEPPSALLATLPERGRTPMPFFGTTEQQGPKAKLSLEVPRATLRDVGAALFR